MAGQIVVSPVSGTVERLSNPYRNDQNYNGLLIKSTEGVSVFLWYLNPDTNIVGSVVNAGDRLGIAQDLTTKYPAKNGHSAITNHVHVRTSFRNINIDPEDIIPPGN